MLVQRCSSVGNWSVLDAGCGEGKNAMFLQRQGARVRAVDISPSAIRNARAAWDGAGTIDWEIGDVRELEYASEGYDLIIAYGLFHCLPDVRSIEGVISKFQSATKPGGYNVICTFNNRAQDLRAHPGFSPTLLGHNQYVAYYRDWMLIHESDTDLYESHPNNHIPHSHSMTRVIARAPLDYNLGGT